MIGAMINDDRVKCKYMEGLDDKLEPVHYILESWSIIVIPFLLINRYLMQDLTNSFLQNVLGPFLVRINFLLLVVITEILFKFGTNKASIFYPDIANRQPIRVLEQVIGVAYVVIIVKIIKLKKEESISTSPIKGTTRVRPAINLTPINCPDILTENKDDIKLELRSSLESQPDPNFFRNLEKGANYGKNPYWIGTNDWKKDFKRDFTQD